MFLNLAFLFSIFWRPKRNKKLQVILILSLCKVVLMRRNSHIANCHISQVICNPPEASAFQKARAGTTWQTSRISLTKPRTRFIGLLMVILLDFYWHNFVVKTSQYLLAYLYCKNGRGLDTLCQKLLGAKHHKPCAFLLVFGQKHCG